jgi:predicted nucleotidyltransferase
MTIPYDQLCDCQLPWVLREERNLMATASREILAVLQQNRDALRGFGVRRLALFGSYARGEPTPNSDLDFVVELQERSFDSFMGLKLFLEDLFGRPVDLVLEHTIKPRLRPHILESLTDVPGL